MKVMRISIPLAALARSTLIRSVATHPGRWFAYVHFVDPHAPYQGHADGPHFGDRPRDRYLEEVHHTDRVAGELVDNTGAVVDFILLHWGDWRWYVFNIADAAIVVAVALLLADSWLGSPHRGNSHPAEERLS